MRWLAEMTRCVAFAAQDFGEATCFAGYPPALNLAAILPTARHEGGES
jgi:hypothetical protein